MKRMLSAALIALVVGFAASSDASAQAVVALGVGPTFPISDYGDFASTGWLAHGGVNFAVGDAGLAIGGHGYYGSNSHDTDGDKTNLYGALAAIAYSLSSGGSVSPSIFALFGTMTHQYKSESTPAFEGSNTTGAVGAGMSLGFPLGESATGGVQGWLLSGLSDNDGTRIVGLDAFVGIPVGGN